MKNDHIRCQMFNNSDKKNRDCSIHIRNLYIMGGGIPCSPQGEKKTGSSRYSTALLAIYGKPSLEIRQKQTACSAPISKSITI